MPDLIKHRFRDHEFQFTSTPTAPALVEEIFGDNYRILQFIEEGKLSFRPGDVVIDAGACEGMFSIMLSKLFPEIRIIALEPVPTTYYTLCQNLNLNHCQNIEAFCLGLGGKDQKKVVMIVAKTFAGGSTSLCNFNPEDHYQVDVGLISLDAAFELYGIERCRLLKMDIEGMEYEVLYPTTVLPRVDYFVGEFHINSRLEYASRRMDGLINWIANRTKVLFIEGMRMAE